MAPVLLDADILSELLKGRNASVRQNAVTDVQQRGQLAFSAMTRYEIIRGYKSQHATTQLKRFTMFCQSSLVLPISDAVFDRAADLWVTARQGGYPRDDADLLIAATAIEHGLVLVSGNRAHFAWIQGLAVDDWRQP